MNREHQNLEQQYATAPNDPHLQDALALSLVRRGAPMQAYEILERAGRRAEALELLTRDSAFDQFIEAPERIERVAEFVRMLFDNGRRVEAGQLLSIRWEIDLKKLDLTWRGRHLEPEDIDEIVRDDLAQVDLVRLAASFPRRKDGHYLLNTSRTICRYRAHQTGEEHRKLMLLAYTPGTSTCYDRPKDRGKHLLTVTLETRATRPHKLPSEAWVRRPA
ncbi:MAG: hypothetical protein AUK47_08465 [Deltaproteobacteria bacterium CG2_30_63_29]|nr:MAG: hypothetical protein AUK47_08465 [Deltaproteobacteria bacterium CG2_30_63_29]